MFASVKCTGKDGGHQRGLTMRERLGRVAGRKDEGESGKDGQSGRPISWGWRTEFMVIIHATRLLNLGFNPATPVLTALAS